MNSVPQISRTIQLGYRSVFQDGRIVPALLWEELEETAEQHCRAIGHNVFSLLRKNEAWVLKSGRSSMFRYPGYGETIEIKSYIRKLDRYKGFREFVLRDSSGTLLGEVSTLWTYMDLEKRTLKPIPEIFNKKWGCLPGISKIEPPRKKDFFILNRYSCETFKVRRRDIDSSSHVHNIRYLEWLMESVPQALYRECQISDLSILYLKELASDASVQVRTADLGGGTFRHDYHDAETDMLLCRAASRWKSKISLYGLARSESLPLVSSG